MPAKKGSGKTYHQKRREALDKKNPSYGQKIRTGRAKRLGAYQTHEGGVILNARTGPTHGPDVAAKVVDALTKPRRKRKKAKK